MGNDVGDINNDGLLDVVVLDMLPDDEKIRKQSGGEDDYELFQIKRQYGYYYQFVRNTLQLNLGNNKFSEIGLLAGIYSTDWSWSPLFCDVDNDGWKDLFITNGIYRRANDLDYVRFLTGGNRFFPEKQNSDVSDKELYEKMPLYPAVNYIFKNNRDLTFTNMASEWGFHTRSYSNGSTYADLDNDGDLDLVVNNINEEAYIFRNNASEQQSHHYLSVICKGKDLNTRGIGTRVTIYSGGMQQVADLFPTRGFMSAVSDVLHFGLGTAESIDSLVVRWPDRSEQILRNIQADQVLALEMGNAIMPPPEPESETSGSGLLNPELITGLEFRHREDGYTDFRRELLIPHSLSAEGPSMAVGDVNGDGLDDLFAGGAKGQASLLFAQQQNGNFTPIQLPLFLTGNADEVDAAFFDADNDGDQDLYLVRGGNEIPAGNPLLADQLLINNGKGLFSKGLLPMLSHNGSCVRPGDFDGDGDPDLFVGSRSIPGAYGWPPDQFLLENNGHGRFTDVTDERSAELKNAGMVTDARWFDYDGDGDLDLAMAGEWMKVTIFRNDNGYFTDVTGKAGLDASSGWWFCLEVADIEGDGDPDLIGGNLGLNSLLKATPKEPLEMYLNDFDNNGTLDQVICSYQNGISYPVASLDELAGQLPYLGKLYARYSDFGGKTVRDIFETKVLQQSILKKAVLLESCIFLNNGKGAFTKFALPKEAQFSPVRDILVQFLNQDSIADIILVGNNYAVRPSLGRYDASYGWCLLGEKQGGFKALLPMESGFSVNGDARRILPFKAGSKSCLVAATNNGEIQVFRVR
jgi:hypothetical protein